LLLTSRIRRSAAGKWPSASAALIVARPYAVEVAKIWVLMMCLLLGRC